MISTRTHVHTVRGQTGCGATIQPYCDRDAARIRSAEVIYLRSSISCSSQTPHSPENRPSKRRMLALFAFLQLAAHCLTCPYVTLILTERFIPFSADERSVSPNLPQFFGPSQPGHRSTHRWDLKISCPASSDPHPVPHAPTTQEMHRIKLLLSHRHSFDQVF